MCPSSPGASVLSGGACGCSAEFWERQFGDALGSSGLLCFPYAAWRAVRSGSGSSRRALCCRGEQRVMGAPRGCVQSSCRSGCALFLSELRPHKAGFCGR